MVAQFFKDHPVAKILLVVAAGVLGVAAISATFYSQHQIVAAKSVEEARQKAIREGLGDFIGTGNSLMQACTDPKSPAPTEAADQWANSVEAFLLTDLGNSYVRRFRDPTGIPRRFHVGAGAPV